MPGAAFAADPLAQVICAPPSELVDRLTHQYGAQLAGMGLRTVEATIEVWATRRGDWTLVQSYADGNACIVAMGEGWEPSPRATRPDR